MYRNSLYRLCRELWFFGEGNRLISGEHNIDGTVSYMCEIEKSHRWGMDRRLKLPAYYMVALVAVCVRRLTQFHLSFDEIAFCLNECKCSAGEKERKRTLQLWFVLVSCWFCVWLGFFYNYITFHRIQHPSTVAHVALRLQVTESANRCMCILNKNMISLLFITKLIHNVISAWSCIITISHLMCRQCPVHWTLALL